jgi:hypothetical protein
VSGCPAVLTHIYRGSEIVLIGIYLFGLKGRGPALFHCATPRFSRSSFFFRLGQADGPIFFFAIFGGLLALAFAFVANRLVRFTHVPDAIILMAAGVLIGPVLHWVNPDIFRGATQGFGSA